MSDAAYISEQTSSMDANSDVYRDYFYTCFAYCVIGASQHNIANSLSHILNIIYNKGSTFTSGIIIYDN